MNLLDPETYRAVRRPLLEAETLPPACYTSHEFYRREVSEIFLKCWNLVGRSDYVKNPGDYFTHTVAGVSFIVMRGDDGEIRAFANACRHRGAKLLEGEGNARSIKCPYHSWVYDSSGRLRGANGMRDTQDFDSAGYGLVGLRLETWEGFLFVNFDSSAEPLSKYLAGISRWTDSYGFSDMVTVGRREFTLRANWKSYVENSLEHFHLPTVHQKTIGGVRAVWEPVDGAPGNFVILRSKTTESRATLDNSASFGHMPGLRGPAAEGDQYFLIYPCTVIGAHLDCMWFKQMVPDGPDSMRLMAGFCFTKACVERPDFEDIVKNYHRRFELVMAEDNGIAELHLQGVLNPFARPGRFSSVEPLVHTIDNWILDRVVGKAEGPT